MINVTQTAVTALKELETVVAGINKTDIDALIRSVCAADSVYITGAGRSLLMLKCFAMRLMHIGINSYVVGDATTPAFGSGDLLIVGSGSGNTAFPLLAAKKAKEIGGKVALITANGASAIGDISDIVVKIPAYTDKIADCGVKKPVLPTASQFEEALLILTDSLILPLGECTGVSTDGWFERHANLE